MTPVIAEMEPVAITAMLSGVAIVAILGRTIRRTATDKERERTAREIAAYVAEGSMTPDEGERLLKATRPRWEA